MNETKETFREVNESYTIKEAIDEAKRCLNCKNPSCKKGCPIENDIPDFIHQLSMGNMGDAMRIINEKSNLPAICGRVCPHEKLDTEMNLIREKLPQKTRGKIAVIGSGPAGLTVAGDLARQGFNVTIFEGQSEAGGVLMYGIPEYRLPKAVVTKEIKKIEALGVNFVLNCLVGKDITVDQMFEQGYDAIFIGTGTALPKSLDVPGSKFRGIIQSSYLLHMVSIFNQNVINRDAVPLKEGDRVAVIGCGNVAMDAARTSVRMGASSVTVLYHRTEADMSAIPSEYQEAVKEGVKFMWKTSTKEFLGNEEGKVTGIRAETPKGIQDLPFDRVLLAIGSRPANRIVSTTTGIDVDETGYVIVKERPYGMTTRKGVFAGGDKAAKQVAAGIAQYVDAVKLLEE